MGRKASARFGSYAIVMHSVSAFSDALRQEMPAPFRHMTPLRSEVVARSVVAAVRRGRRRVVLPRNANMLLLGEALSPRIGDLIASALTMRPIARLLRMSRGTTYHEAISSI
ncbi:hypothetical protein EAH80_24370 [Mycobacterium hodleri]|uniref:Uncharacterized protein n=2 Tax=Mycolicibacterium hodleri TaxID=49897 RepID=A0A502E3N3_9MYCO|nr:hypothetical protein EAH80_24370 [Mycolicibacterium hodleri]